MCSVCVQWTGRRSAVEESGGGYRMSAGVCLQLPVETEEATFFPSTTTDLITKFDVGIRGKWRLCF